MDRDGRFKWDAFYEQYLHNSYQCAWTFQEKMISFFCLFSFLLYYSIEFEMRVSSWNLYYYIIESVLKCSCSMKKRLKYPIKQPRALLVSIEFPIVVCVRAPFGCVSSCCSVVWTYIYRLGTPTMAIFHTPIAYGSVSCYYANKMNHIHSDIVWKTNGSVYPNPSNSTNLERNTIKPFGAIRLESLYARWVLGCNTPERWFFSAI